MIMKWENLTNLSITYSITPPPCIRITILAFSANNDTNGPSQSQLSDFD